MSGMFSFRLTLEEETLVNEYMSFHNIEKMTDFVKSAMFEKIEADLDIKLGKEAKDYLATNPKLYTSDEAWEEIDV